MDALCRTAARKYLGSPTVHGLLRVVVAVGGDLKGLEMGRLRAAENANFDYDDDDDDDRLKGETFLEDMLHTESNHQSNLRLQSPLVQEHGPKRKAARQDYKSEYKKGSDED
ncbi:zinc finger [Striga asiatica]|uniref:Zinc finger n=1 Tax=Striga asiatica TaxID=4170 RepID=A0A5A7Q0E8_STRAF|nr:zinc finger [Striga asiatica]